MIRVSERVRQWCVSAAMAVAVAVPSAAPAGAEPVQAGGQPVKQTASSSDSLSLLPSALPSATPFLQSATRAASLLTTTAVASSEWRPPGRAEEPRPRGLMPLYAGFGALQALDAHSTLRAVRAGRTESNPIIAPFADRPGVMVGVKAAAAAGTIALSERLWRRNRGAALTLMIVANVGYAAVVAHNYRQGRR